MASRMNALKVIERLDGSVLYGSRVRVSFASRETRDSFWRQKRGVVDSGKMSILSTCAIGWVKKVVSIRALAQEMAEARLEGFELMWVTGSMVLLAFPDAETCGRLVLSPSMWSTWFDRLEEWSDLILRKGRAVSNGVIGWSIRHAGRTDGLIETIKAEGTRGGASSAGAVLDATEGDRTRDCDEAAPNQVSVTRKHSNLGIFDTSKGEGESIVGLGHTALATEVVVGAAGAMLIPTIGTIPGGVRKVKSVTSLVEALSSSAQQRVIAVARSKRGRSQPARNHGLVGRVEEGVCAPIDGEEQAVLWGELAASLKSESLPL
ncbi:hypothetical protein V6N11_058488 [Hibiscus sabdariffa]|uniref:DUF4283 domain-containing protein n=1 Tax=Hibiscus sabdariffa TaxID=183260 RepID=A0ABR2U4H0_9ROSI